MADKLNIYFCTYAEGDADPSNDRDTFVAAASPEEAANYWREAWEDDNGPGRVFRINTDAARGVLPWHDPRGAMLVLEAM